MRSRDSDLIILMGPFQCKIFYDSMNRMKIYSEK